MSIYAIGDVQGCFDSLQRLLQHIKFNAAQDILWFAGDIVNRGPDSLAVLRFIKALGFPHQVVLGNHDLHLLAVAYQVSPYNKEDTFNDILMAPDKEELITWLAHRPLLIHDPAIHTVMTHAGIAPMWTLAEAKQLAHEVEEVLQSENIHEFLANLYGNQPNYWQPDLTGVERLRCIVNYFTRMRFCDDSGRLDLAYKGEIFQKPAPLKPWFEIKNNLPTPIKILFGHWAALNGKASVSHVYPLDTGCVWGGCLSAMRLSDQQYFKVQC